MPAPIVGRRRAVNCWVPLRRPALACGRAAEGVAFSAISNGGGGGAGGGGGGGMAGIFGAKHMTSPWLLYFAEVVRRKFVLNN